MKTNGVLPMRALSLAVLVLLTACSSKQEIKYPAEVTNMEKPAAGTSTFETARLATSFKDKDIQVPANFDARGLEECNFDINNESAACPLKKPVIRVYFDGNTNDSDTPEEAAVIKQLNNKKLGLILESQLAGLNRFRIVTKDELTTEELKQQIKEQSTKEMAKHIKANRTLRPDYLLKIDTIKAADRFYAEYNGMAQYSVELTASMINPLTKEKLAYPNIGKIRIQGTDVKPKQELVYTEVNGRYYTGFDYTKADNINAVFNKMASKAFDHLLARLLTEMPATAQVQAFRNGQVTLDRGRNAGLLNKDTVILFSYDSGFIDPIAVATVTPSSESAIAQIVRWKDNKLAKSIRDNSDGSIFKPTARIFAVTTGLPQHFQKTRM
jgi:hypothetical protein